MPHDREMETLVRIITERVVSAAGEVEKLAR